MPKKEVLIGIAIVFIVMLIGLLGVKVDHHYNNGKLSVEENRAVHRFYAPFYTEIEFDLKCEPANTEEYAQPDYNFNVLVDASALSFTRIPADYNKLEINETRHYKVVFSTFKNRLNSKTIEVVVYDEKGNVIDRGRESEPSGEYFVDVGVEGNGDNIKVTNVTYKEGGIVMHYLAKYYYVALVYILSLFAIPRLEGKIINEKSLKGATLKFVALTTANLIIIINILMFNVFNVSTIVEFFGLNKMQEVIVNHKLLFEVVCLIMLIGAVRETMYEYVKGEEKDKKKFALHFAFQLFVHFMFVVTAIISVIVIIVIIKNLLGILAAIFVIGVMGLGSIGSMSDKDVIGAYAFYHLLPKD